MKQQARGSCAESALSYTMGAFPYPAAECAAAVEGEDIV